MSDYSPIYLPGNEITCTTSAAVTGGQLLAVSGSGTVAPAAVATGAKVVGVAAFDAASGATVTVFARGMVHSLIASGTVTAGDQVVAGAAGTVASLAAASGTPDAAAVNAARSVIGVALTTAADTVAVQVMEF